MSDEKKFCHCKLESILVQSNCPDEPHRRFWACKNFFFQNKCDYMLWHDLELSSWYKTWFQVTNSKSEFHYKQAGELGKKLGVAMAELEDVKKRLVVFERLELEKKEMLAAADQEVLVLQRRVERLRAENARMKRMIIWNGDMGHEQRQLKSFVCKALLAIFVCVFAVALVKLAF